MSGPPLDYLSGFPLDMQERVKALTAQGELQRRLAVRYPDRHAVQSSSALYTYVQDLKRQYLRSSPPLGKVRYCDKISTLHQALGLHTYAVRVQGKRLKRRNELRVASLFKELAPEFLRMVVVHELAHLRHRDHDRAFYRLCEHMEPEYARYETDVRLTLHCRSLGPVASAD